MPAPYYADANLAQGGTNSGTSTNPWLGAKGLQHAYDLLAAGEKGYMRGTFLLNDGSRTGDADGNDGDPIDLDANSGTSTSAIKVFGTAADWSVDGTLAIIDGNGAATECLIWGVGKVFWDFHNVTFTGATGDGMKGGGAATCGSLFTNCHFDDNGGHGADCDIAANLRNICFVQCSFNNNDGRGLYGQNFVDAYLCDAIGNGSIGMTLNVGRAFACVSHGNQASYGIGLNGTPSAAICCASDGNSGDAISSQSGAMILGCRLTNSTVDSVDPSALGYLFYNYYDNSISDSGRMTTEIKGVETNLTTGLEGYEDRANDKLNLIMGAAGFRTVIPIDANNDAVIAMGLPTVPIVWPREG